MSSPSTSITLYSVDFSNDYRHVVYFKERTKQTEYFNNKRVLGLGSTFSFVRKSSTRLKVILGLNALSVYESVNYASITQDGKTRYYFVSDVDYVGENTVELTIELDVMQTYMFDYSLQPCFVEREHAAVDDVGYNTVEEDLELGYFVNGDRYEPELGSLSILVMSTVTLNTFDAEGKPYFNRALGGTFDGIYSGCNIYAYDANDTLSLLGTLMNLEKEGKIDAIVGMWMYPKKLIETNITGQVTSTKVAGIEFNAIQSPLSVNGYTPKNKKLLTYPFCYLYATNNTGNHAIYRYERFDGGISFTTEGSIYPDGGIKFTPKNYNGTGFNYDESLTLTGFPTCAWNADSYKIWLAQNQNQQNLGYVASGASIIGGIALMATGAGAGVGAGMIAGGVMGIGNQLAQKSDMQTHPPQSRGQTSSTLNTAIGIQCIHVYERSITLERAQIIDNYFTMFGYKTLRVKTPGRDVRESFTYTKTQGCLITASFSQNDVRKIQSIYDNGVTFWHPDVAIGNYNASNRPKSEV